MFGGLKDTGILRAELRRLFRWLRDRGITAVVTAERGEQMFTRQGLEEYITDAVISLDHRVHEQISTRRIRVVKYRGSTHGTNEYPFLIDRDGITVLPVTSLLLEHEAPNERVSSRPARRSTRCWAARATTARSTVLLSGTAGTGKTTLAAHFVDAACARGEKCLYFLFEESPQQMIRNMRSAGVDLAALGRQGPAASSMRIGRIATDSKPTCSKCTTRSKCSNPMWSSWTRSPTSGRRHEVRRALHAHARHRLS